MEPLELSHRCEGPVGVEQEIQQCRAAVAQARDIDDPGLRAHPIALAHRASLNRLFLGQLVDRLSTTRVMRLIAKESASGLRIRTSQPAMVGDPMEKHIIERAFELAPGCENIEEIRTALRREGYSSVDAHLAGRIIRADLTKLLNRSV
mgnify:CR=1 FL=1